MNHGTRSCYVKRKCRCEPCRAANATYQRSLVAKDPEKESERKRLAYSADPGKERDRCRKYYEANREKINARLRAYRDENGGWDRGRANKVGLNYYWNNREKINERKRAYREVKGPALEARRRAVNAMSRDAATRNGTAYTPAEDAIALDTSLSLSEAAYILSRSIGSVRGRRKTVRRSASSN